MLVHWDPHKVFTGMSVNSYDVLYMPAHHHHQKYELVFFPRDKDYQRDQISSVWNEYWAFPSRMLCAQICDPKYDPWMLWWLKNYGDIPSLRLIINLISESGLDIYKIMQAEEGVCWFDYLQTCGMEHNWPA